MFSFSTVKFQNGRWTVSRYFGRVPFAVVDGHGAEPNVPFFGPQAIQVVPEMQFAVFNLQTQYNIVKHIS